MRDSRRHAIRSKIRHGKAKAAAKALPAMCVRGYWLAGLVKRGALDREGRLRYPVMDPQTGVLIPADGKAREPYKSADKEASRGFGACRKRPKGRRPKRASAPAWDGEPRPVWR